MSDDLVARLEGLIAKANERRPADYPGGATHKWRERTDLARRQVCNQVPAEITRLQSELAGAREKALREAAAVADRHVDRARMEISTCMKWSAYQSEMSRARDLGLEISEGIAALIDKEPDPRANLRGGES